MKIKKYIIFAVILTIIQYNHTISSHNTIDFYMTNATRLFKEKKPEEALPFSLKALELDPQNNKALYATAALLNIMKRWEEACEYYKKYLALNPSNHTVQYDFARILLTLEHYDEAQKLLENLLQKQPDNIEIQNDLVKLYLRMADWKNASRFRNPDSYWWYNENIYGKKFLINLINVGAGAGDIFQFIRYAKRLNQAGAHVIVQTESHLIPLLSLCPYINQFITDKNPEPIYDKKYTLCIGTLILRMQDVLDYQTEVPYLYANKQLVEQWKQKLSEDKNFKVGICWQSTICRSAYTDKLIHGPRSFELKKLSSLAEIPGISLYSLQKTSLEQLRGIKPNFPLKTFEKLDEEQGAFMDSAAIIKNLDLVITVDTSMAHLAGALGARTWLMIGHDADYRWLYNRTDTPWYPTMRLFRQSEPENWDSVIQIITKELSALIKSSL